MNDNPIGSEHPVVSVVIPCLNRSRFLVPTLESILGQDYPNVECIVMDGGSSDGTIEALKGYGDRIRWVSEPDHGPADAINKGWRMARGEILAWLNADDVWEVPRAVSQAVDFLNEHPEVDVAYGDCGRIDEEGHPMGMSYLHEWDLEYALEYCDHCIPQPASFMRRRIVDKIGGLDPTFVFLDRDLWYRIALAGGTIQHVPLLWAHGRKHESYWHARSWIASADCIRAVRKCFSNKQIPARIRHKKSRCISNAYLRGMDYTWIGRHWRTILWFALRGALADPSNALDVMRRVRYYAEQDASNSAALRGMLAVMACFNRLRKTGKRPNSGFSR